MVSSHLFILAPALYLASSAYAANDWSKPCFGGECSYDLPTTENSATGTLRIWGASSAITDITTAAGWMILGCSPTATAQDIRLVCQSDDAEGAGCSNLYDNGGAVNKIVRLPENCGGNAFARIARAWVPEDQSIPASVSARMVRRDGSPPPEVKALALDTDFSSIDQAKTGSIGIAIEGMNVPGYENRLANTPVARQLNGRYVSRDKRGLFDIIDDIGDFIKGALDAFNNFDVEKSVELPPIDVDKPFNLFDQSIECGAVKAQLKVDVDAKAHAIVDIGLVATGTIVPPKLDNFNVFTGMTADIKGTLDVLADATGTLDTGEITIFEVGIPGLDFPGILQIGPSFKINTQAKATLDVQMDMTVGFDYKIDKAQVVFPPNKDKKSGGNFNVADTPLKLAVSPGVKATGTLEAHLIPTLDLGIDALGVATATVFINLDAAAILQLTLEARANATAEIGGQSSSSVVHASSSAVQATSSAIQSMSSVLGSMTSSVLSSSSAAHAMASSSAVTTSHAMKPASSVVNAHIMTASASSSATHVMSTSSASAHVTSSASITSSATHIMSTVSSSPSVSHTMSSVASLASSSAAAHVMSPSVVPSSSAVHAMPSAPAVQAHAMPRRHLAHLSQPILTTDEVSNPEARAVTSTGTSFGGCVELKAGLSVNAGADADLFGLFNTGTSVALFEKEFELFKKCFGDAPAPKRSLVSDVVPVVRRLKRQNALDLLCPSAGVGKPETVTEGDVKAKDIKAVKRSL